MADTDAASKANSAADLTGHTPTELALTVSLFKTRHTAYGVMQQMTWRAFTDLFRRRRQGDKTGKNFVLAEFQREPNGRVHRIGANLMARTAIGLDIETSKKMDEIPPPFEDAVERIKARGWAAIVYTSHNHTPALPRFRIVLPISSEIDFKLPVVEVIAKHLDLSGVLDTGKVGGASVFYFPSAEPGQLAHHQTEIISGKPIAAEWITECAAAILAAREAEQKRQRARDLEAATKRREDRIARGLDPDHSIIEAVRDRLDLVGELIGHGYLQVPGRDDLFLYPGSETRVPGVHILTGRDGVQRVYSHHSGDPLAPGNLPEWCKVRAIDVVDVKAILDYGGDRKALGSLCREVGIQTRRRSASAPPPSGPNGSDHDDDAHDGAQSRVAGDGDPADEPRPPSDETEASGANGHDDPGGAEAADGEEPVDPRDTQQPGKDDIGAAGASESEYARILKIITSATPKTVVGVLISSVLQSDLTPTDEIRLIKITSVQSDDGETRATIPTIKQQLKLAREGMARDRANAEQKAQQRAEQHAQLERQQNPGSVYDRILATIQAGQPEAAVQVLTNQLLRSDVTPSEQDLLIKATKSRSSVSIRAIKQQLKQARDANSQQQRAAQSRGETIEDILPEFNAKYSVINEAGKAVVYARKYDPGMGRQYYDRLRFRDLRDLYLNRPVIVGFDENDRPIVRPAGDAWLAHADRRQFLGGIIFDPSGRPVANDVLNLWQGFAITPKPGSWDLLQRHTHEVLCSGNDGHFRHLLDWSANMIQHPDRQGEVAVILKGDEGIGKGIFARAFLPMFGQHGLQITNANHLTGNFNLQLRDVIYLFPDDCFVAGDQRQIGILKGLITEPYLTIEGKFENPVQTRNYLHLVIASNEDRVVQMAIGARRFFVLDVSDTYKENHSYFAAISKQMDEGGYAAMLYDLQHRDISEFNVRAVIVTQGLLIQKKLSLDTTYKWWSDVLFRGFVWASKLGLEAYFGQWHNVVTMDVLYSSYAEFAKSRHERHPLSREWFGQFINKMGGAPTRPRDEVIGEHLADVPNSYGGTTRKAELVRHPRPHAYALGSLTKARAAFDDATRLTTDWPPDPADTDPIDAFTKSECVTGPGIGVRVEILFKAWVMWCAEQKRDPGNIDDFSKALRDAMPGVDIVQSPNAAGGHINYYRGIQLTDSGPASTRCPRRIARAPTAIRLTPITTSPASPTVWPSTATPMPVQSSSSISGATRSG